MILIGWLQRIVCRTWIAWCEGIIIVLMKSCWLNWIICRIIGLFKELFIRLYEGLFVGFMNFRWNKCRTIGLFKELFRICRTIWRTLCSFFEILLVVNPIPMVYRMYVGIYVCFHLIIFFQLLSLKILFWVLEVKFNDKSSYLVYR